MADATTLETMQTVSSENQPNSDSEDASASGTYGVRPMFQQIQSSLREFSLTSEWTDLNGLIDISWPGSLSPVFINGSTFTYQGNQTARFTVNRRVQAQGSTGFYPIFGSVTSSTYNIGPNNTSIIVAWDNAGAIDNTISDVLIGSLNPAFPSYPINIITNPSQLNYTGIVVGTNAYTTNLSPAPATLAAIKQQPVTLLVTNANTGNVTLSPNGLGPVAVLKWSQGALVQLNQGDIPANSTIILMYDGTEFVLISVANQIPQLDGLGGAKGLTGGSVGSSTSFLLTASTLALRPVGGTPQMILPGFSGGATINIANSGVNGYDSTGPFGATATIHVFAIGGIGVTTALIASLNSAQPASFPAGYTNYAYLFSAILTGGNFYASYLKGNEFFYETSQSVLSGNSGSNTSVSYASMVPGIASQVKLQLESLAVGTGGTGIYTSVISFGIANSAHGPSLNATCQANAASTAANDIVVDWPNTGSFFYITASLGSGTPNPQAKAWVLGYSVPNNA